jgi:hypothetical protein
MNTKQFFANRVAIYRNMLLMTSSVYKLMTLLASKSDLSYTFTFSSPSAHTPVRVQIFRAKRNSTVTSCNVTWSLSCGMQDDMRRLLHTTIQCPCCDAMTVLYCRTEHASQSSTEILITLLYGENNANQCSL